MAPLPSSPPRGFNPSFFCFQPLNTNIPLPQNSPKPFSRRKLCGLPMSAPALCSGESSALPLPVARLKSSDSGRFVERWFIPPRDRKSLVAGLGGSPWQGLCWLRAAQSLGAAICSPSVHLAVLWGGSCNPDTLSTLMAVTAVCVIHRCVLKPGMSPQCCGYHLVSRVMAWLSYVPPAALGAGGGVMLGV